MPAFAHLSINLAAPEAGSRLNINTISGIVQIGNSTEEISINI